MEKNSHDRDYIGQHWNMISEYEMLYRQYRGLTISKEIRGKECYRRIFFAALHVINTYNYNNRKARDNIKKN